MTMFPPTTLSLLLLSLSTEVFGNCCMPTTMSGSMNKNIYSDWPFIHHVINKANFQIDFSTQKIVVFDIDTLPTVQYLMVDFDSDKLYTRNKDGSCIVHDFMYLKGFQSCVPESAVDKNKVLRVKDPKNERWSYYLDFVGPTYSPITGMSQQRTRISTLTLDKGSCLPKDISVRFNPNDLPYTYYLDNVTEVVNQDSFIFHDAGDCITHTHT